MFLFSVILVAAICFDFGLQLSYAELFVQIIKTRTYSLLNLDMVYFATKGRMAQNIRDGRLAKFLWEICNKKNAFSTISACACNFLNTKYFQILYKKIIQFTIIEKMN
jgi:hypothetical protein